MNKSTLLTLTVLAAILVILQSDSSSAGGFDRLNQFKETFLPKEYRNTNLTLDDAKRVLREKCKKVMGHENTTLTHELEKGAAKLMACISTIANLTQVQEEIEHATPLGDLDTVFHKYCAKGPTIKKCLQEFQQKLQPCLTKEEKSQSTIMIRVMISLMGFMCDKGGDQIALFIAEDGPECMEANKEAIGHCMNASFAEYMPKDGTMPDIYNLPELVLAPKHCIDFDRFETCTIHHLEQCQELTPANIAHSVFKFIKNETNCQPILEAKANERSILRDPKEGGGSSTVYHSGVALLVAMTSATFILALQKYFF